MIRFCFFFFSGSGVLGVWYEAGADCFCFAGEGVAEFPAVLFDGEYAAFGVGVKVPVGGCRTDVEECGKFFLGDTGVFVECAEESAGFFAGEEEENRLFEEGVRGRQFC